MRTEGSEEYSLGIEAQPIIPIHLSGYRILLGPGGCARLSYVFEKVARSRGAERGEKLKGASLDLLL